MTAGAAAERFARMVEALGGPADFVDNAPKYLPQAAVVRPVHAEGVLSKVDTRAIGNAIIGLGGGRRKVGQELDLSVGFTQFASTGTRLDSDTPLAVIHAESDAAANRAEEQLRAACTVSTEAVPERPVICQMLDG